MSNIPVVLVVPLPAQGHVNLFMILSQKLVENGCRVVFVNTEFDHKRVVSSFGEQQQHSTNQAMRLVSVPDGLGADDDRKDPSKLFDGLQNSMPKALEKLIKDMNLKGDDRISFIVADLFMAWALDVGSKFGIKGAIVWPASAAIFALLWSFPSFIDDGTMDSDGVILTTKETILISPCMTEMNTRDFFWFNMRDKIEGKIIFQYVRHCCQSLNLAEWWLCNTTHELEPGALSFLPKLLPIGPLLRSYDTKIGITKAIGQYWEEDLSCMNWLDEQHHGTVLYVAFGSFTQFDQNQFNELALGLALTYRPFLWVIREDSNMEYPHEFKGHKGKIVSWAPQQKVLSHPAIACFVTHCGWNSTIEGLSNGVPFLCWPYFGDQIQNKKYICDELKVGLSFDKDENGVVSCKEVKLKVEQLLSDENIKSRSLELKEKVMNNIVKGGASLENLKRIVKWLKE
ncbi:UDP-glycosyltransferase 83A1-like isoform X1 [Vigna radiata var. radiata]|uniref:UDP-glycosyltransferase 83A1-like isoform X1 n=1 Tax=Vigna radiata var. radiata TaxID=3916 RepID=A0A1S3VAW6_VIGRR|nr:UDP-glycosyltransferase 83A1-like isoform X1 [Vigna radiata var. radiata]